MGQVVSFENYRPIARYDSLPWTRVRIDEAADAQGPFGEIDLITLDPVDDDPANPSMRNFTTINASLANGWYRIVWMGENEDEAYNLPVQHFTSTLAPTALCTDEDVRLYLGIKTTDIDDEDRSVIIRLVNAASETFADESQRLWIVPPEMNPQTRTVSVENFDIARYWARTEDFRSLSSVMVQRLATQSDPSSLDLWYLSNESIWENALGAPVYCRLNWPLGAISEVGTTLAIEGVYGWCDDLAGVPEKVRQAVIYTAAEWYARDVQKFSATFSLDEGRILVPRLLPAAVQNLAETYRRWRVA